VNQSTNEVARLAAALADRYTIDRELGAGGMATVYLAQDIKHHRKVAIKVLRPELAAVIGAERFLAEIRTTANLQHPHILPLHDSGNADSSLFYVMPYVEGVSLRDRITREHQLPIDDAVRIASEVADALEYAHQQGIIHRDIKPENILLQGGHALVADFGIALAASKAGGRMTETGMSLGTPQYMSPEQAMGEREITPASDVYALGAVTYEMLTGEAPFTGPTAQAIVAKVMTGEPADIVSLRKTVPAHVADAVHVALQKLPADRFASARQFADALQGRSTIAMPRSASRTAAATRGGPPRTRRLEFGLGAVAVAAIAMATWLGLHRPTSPSPGPVQFIVTGKGVAEPVYTLTWPATVSPDGRTVVYAGSTGNGRFQYFVRDVGHLESRPLPGTVGGSQPVFSPDGQWLAFQAQDGVIKKVRLDGGAPIPVVPYNEGNGMAWSRSGTIIAGSGNKWLGLTRVPENGGELTPLTRPDTVGGNTLWHIWPVLLADDKTILFSVWNQLDRTTRGSELAVTSLDDGVVHRTGLHVTRALGMSGDYLIYLAPGGVVMATRFDLGHYRPLGSPVLLIDSIPFCATCNGDGAMNLSLSGALAYMRGTSRGRLIWVGQDHKEQDAGPDAPVMLTPRLSPDDTKIAVEVDENAHKDIWLWLLTTMTPQKLTNVGDNSDPEWSPDGRSIQFLSTRDGTSGVWRLPIDGSREAEKVLSAGAALGWGAVPAPDQKHVLLQTTTAAHVVLVTATLGADTTQQPFMGGGFNAWGGRFSPNGKWVAYVSDESGRPEVYIREFPGPGARIPISNSGGTEPVWSWDGLHLYYAAGNQLTRANLSPEPHVGLISRDSLFSGPFFSTIFAQASYDVAKDGRFLMIRQTDEHLQLVVTLNWTAELAARLGKP
jgi:Tol biopolymer transport system component/tRNA A-37 threonylcarbamoyl transferase component Bud32